MYEKKEEPKGELKRQVAQFTLSDFEVRGIVVNGLVNAGYDVITKPIQGPSNIGAIGEEITVFKKEVIRNGL